MKMVQEKRKKGGAIKNIALLTCEDAQINEISKEFFPGRIFKRGKVGHAPSATVPIIRNRVHSLME